jgi:hypothetical protein
MSRLIQTSDGPVICDRGWSDPQGLGMDQIALARQLSTVEGALALVEDERKAADAELERLVPGYTRLPR